jgi:predicted benzoate:H+ symporter BenE
MSAPPGAVTSNRRCEETAQMRYYTSLAAAAALLVSALFGADVTGYWP